MFTNKSVTRLDNPKGAMILNLPLFPAGCQTAMGYIPSSTQGIYAWFRSFHYPNDPDLMFQKLVEDIERPKFSERIGVINPYYEIGVRSFGKVSDGKRGRLKEALNNFSFRQELKHAIGNSILFQSPLYVGKSSNLRSRVEQHLALGSPLRTRLEAVGIELDNSLLMICPLGGNDWEANDSDLDEQTDVSDILEESSLDGDQNALVERYEDLFEEIISRLFSPQFSERIG